MGLRPFTFNRTFVFPVPPERLWATLSDTGQWVGWWPWLRRLDGDGLVEGGRSHCVVRAPLPYTLRFSVEVRRLVAGRLVDAWVSGDLEGPARLEVDAHPEGARAQLAWDVEVRQRLLRRLPAVSRPLMEWGHNWVVEVGLDQFRRRALRV